MEELERMKGSLCETIINRIVVSELIVRIAPSLRRIPEPAKAVGFIKGWHKRKGSSLIKALSFCVN